MRGKQAVLTDIMKSIARRLPKIGPLVAQYEDVRRAYVPPGHFFSPIPSLTELKRDEARIFCPPTREIPGVDLREAEQLELLKVFCRYYADQPFTAKKKAGNRYYFENPSYSHSDAIMLHCMLRHLRPRRLIEVGSGYSSCVTLDTNEQFLGGAVELTFIEPFPELLYSLVNPEDKTRMQVHHSRLQEVELSLFDSLEANDILFIDSTHVSKTDSDVNRAFFEILPRLKPGVHIHFHDVFYPFEYPREWVFEGRAWNEQYLLRAFLQYNSSFRVVLMNTFVEYFHESFFRENMPLCLENRGGSIWLAKT
jgi:hypothetical protein